MACYHPVRAWQDYPEQQPYFGDPRSPKTTELKLPCGKCIGCRSKRVADWATRCMHERQMHDQNSFITLTYDDKHYEPELNYSHFQAFFGRLRITYRNAQLQMGTDPTQLKTIRFFACGEYGETTNRPHWHALIFGFGFADRTPIGQDLYRSKTLEMLWKKGMSTVGDITWESAGYVAGYTMKKQAGKNALPKYAVDTRTGELKEVPHEMGRMSLRPAIGKSWFQKYHTDLYNARDGVVKPGGLTTPAPRYYDKLLERQDPAKLQELKTKRREKTKTKVQDETRQRLQTRELVHTARLNRKGRTL